MKDITSFIREAAEIIVVWIAILIIAAREDLSRSRQRRAQ